MSSIWSIQNYIREFENIFPRIRESLKEKSPLIHCITSPIAINDCANVVLAVGAKPIMAEHPAEVTEITRMADALSVSLANITDARMKSIFLSGKTAKEHGIPFLIDLVGITCSPFRLDLAQRFIRELHPTVIKGNVSEIRALCGCDYDAVGVDVGKGDELSHEREESLQQMKTTVADYASRTGAVVLATGAIDVLSDGERTLCLENGSPYMAKVTGTGCILSCLTASFLGIREFNAFDEVVLAVLIWGIAGELGDLSKGLGTYHVSLLDQLSGMDDFTIKRHMKLT